MNLIKMFQKIYEDLFGWAFDNEHDLNRTFTELFEFHDKALPESKDKLSQTYSKIFKSKWFYLVSPLVFMWLKFIAMKYTNQEYLQRMIEKDLES